MNIDNQNAFEAGQTVTNYSDDNHRDAAFPAYRQAVEKGFFKPSVSASVCFVAGYLGNAYPSHDSRVTS